MIRRALLGVVLALLVLLGASTVPATADDATPAPPTLTPPPLPDPTEGPTGPTFVITPGVGGSELPAPSDAKAVEKAEKADQARQRAGTKKPAGTGRSTDPGSEVPGVAGTATTGPQTPLVTPVGTGEEVAPVLRAFAALVAMVVLFEITAVRRSVFRRRRRGPVTAG